MEIDSGCSNIQGIHNKGEKLRIEWKIEEILRGRKNLGVLNIPE